jgi:hypothetical protein
MPGTTGRRFSAVVWVAGRRRSARAQAADMKEASMRYVACFALVAALVFAISSRGPSQTPREPSAEKLSSNQALMRDKLVQMNLVLEGITLDKFDQVEESAKMLGMISQATSWHISEPTAEYERLSKNFQEQAADLERHAKEDNVEAATLDLVRMNITCTHCHHHMREIAKDPR